MGALFFIFFMLFVAFIALMIIIISLVKNLVSRKGKGEQQFEKGSKKPWGVKIGLWILAIPLIWVISLNIGNRLTNFYIDTGVYIEGGFQNDHFSIKGKDYRLLPVGKLGKPMIGDAVATWTEEQRFLEKIFGYINAGNYYEVINEMNFDLLKGNGYLFCAESQWERAEQWYTDKNHYQLFFDRGVKDNGLVMVDGIHEDILATLEIMNNSYDEKADNIVKVEMPRKDYFSTYAFRLLSQDYVIEQAYFSFKYYDGALYLYNFSSSVGEITTYYLQPLPEEINLILLENIASITGDNLQRTQTKGRSFVCVKHAHRDGSAVSS